MATASIGISTPISSQLPAIAVLYTLYARACDGGEYRACVELAEAYKDGKGVAKDAARYEALLDRACAAGWDNKRCKK